MAKYPELKTPDGPYAGDVTAQSAWAELARNPAAILIDVRTPVEWSLIGKPDLSSIGREPLYLDWVGCQGKEPGFRRKLQVELERLNIDRNAPVFFMCQSGGRSKIAAIDCTALGYKAAHNIGEGFEGDLDEQQHRNSSSGWKVAGLPWRQT